MILFSETSTNKYYCIEVPRDAHSIFIDGAYSYSKQLCFLTRQLGILESVSTQIGFEEIRTPKILGVIGPEDSIHEELGAEIFEDYYDLGMSTFHRIKNKLEPEGILIENPIERPKKEWFGSQNDPLYQAYHRDIIQKKKEWQSYESKLKKVVIIKTEK